MEKTSKKENTQNFSQMGEQEDGQIKFYSTETPEELPDHQIIKEILSSIPLEEDKTSEIEEGQEQLSFEDFFNEHGTEAHFQEIQEQAPIDTPMHGEPEQKSHAEIAKEMSVQDIQLHFQDEFLPIDTREIEEELGDLQLDKSDTPLVNSPKSSAKIRKNTRGAFYVLKDIFGDIETEEDKLATQDYEVSSRKKLGALFLAITLGFLGAHRLYLGHYQKVPAYLVTIGFWWVSKEFLPDLGLANLLAIIMVFWILADILAILFSRKIRDGKNRVLERWI